MKFVARYNNYIASGNNGVFPDAFIQDEMKIINGSEYFRIDFYLYYKIEGKIIKSNFMHTLTFDEIHNDTYITNDEGEPQEIVEFLLAGGEYSKEKIVDWGKPGALEIRKFFDMESIWDELELDTGAFYQIAIDWVTTSLYIDGFPISENFEYVAPTKEEPIETLEEPIVED